MSGDSVPRYSFSCPRNSSATALVSLRRARRFLVVYWSAVMQIILSSPARPPQVVVSANGRQPIRIAALAVQPLVVALAAHEVPRGRVPAQAAAVQVREVAEVADGHRAGADL